MLDPNLRRRVTAAAVLARLRVQRRRAAEDPAFGLFRTHTFEVGDTINTAAAFPDSLTDEVTFATAVRRTDTGSSGLVFEIGSSTAGVAVAVSGADLVIGAGAAAASDAGVTLTITDALPAVDVTFRLVVAVRPALGLVACWINGRLAGSAIAVDEELAAWSDTGDGSVGAAPAGTVTDRIPGADDGAPSDFDVVQPLSVYRRQRPRFTPTYATP